MTRRHLVTRKCKAYDRPRRNYQYHVTGIALSTGSLHVGREDQVEIVSALFFDVRLMRRSRTE
jgi:hypothetical protein